MQMLERKWKPARFVRRVIERTVFISDVDHVRAVALNAGEYVRRLARAVKYFILAAAVGLAVVFLFTAADASFAGGRQGVESFVVSSSSALGLAFPVWIDEDGVHTNPSQTSGSQGADDGGEFSSSTFWLYASEVLLVSLIASIFTGSLTEVFLSPVNPIKVAPFAVANQLQRCLSVKVWVCYPRGTFLQDVRISLSTFSDDVYDFSAINLGGSTGASNRISIVDHVALRGVWTLRIPFGTRESEKLLAYFQKHKKSNPGLQIVVKGTAPSGGNVVVVRRFTARDMVAGRVDHALHHCPARFWDSNDNRRPCFGNFLKLVRLDNLGDRNADYRTLINVDQMNYDSLGDCARADLGEEGADGEDAQVVFRAQLADDEARQWVEVLDELVGMMPAEEAEERAREVRRASTEPSTVWNPHTSLRELLEIMTM